MKMQAIVGILLAVCIGVSLVACGGREPIQDTASKVEGRQARPLRILVVGCDDAASLCDVMLLLKLSDTGADIVQLPRDTYASYTKGSYRKLNGALRTLGDMPSLCSFLEDTLGTDIDGYVRMDTEAFCSVVDAVGGVTVTLPCEMRYTDPEQGLTIALPAGEQHLDGERALQFVRFRSAYVRGDLGRLDAQKIFLSAFLRQVRESLTPMGAIRLVCSLMGKLHTDLSVAEAISAVRRGLALPPSQVRMVTLPGQDAQMRSGAWFYFVSRPSALKVIREHIDGDVTEECFDTDRVLCSGSMSSYYGEEVCYTVHTAEEANTEGIEIERTKKAS